MGEWIGPGGGSGVGGSGGGAAAATVPNLPQAFGYLGWTMDPETSSATRALTNNTLSFSRVRCTLSGSAGHVGYMVTTGGTLPVASQNYVGIYDTGQALAGSATLLAASAATAADTTFYATGIYSTALAAPATLIAGQDYFVAFLANFTGTAPSFTGQSQGNLGFVNLGLTQLQLRTGQSAGFTVLPATILGSAIVASGVGIAAVVQV